MVQVNHFQLQVKICFVIECFAMESSSGLSLYYFTAFNLTFLININLQLNCSFESLFKNKDWNVYTSIKVSSGS